MCVCMCVRVFQCMCMFICEYMHVCIYLCIYLYMHTCNYFRIELHDYRSLIPLQTLMNVQRVLLVTIICVLTLPDPSPVAVEMVLNWMVMDWIVMVRNLRLFS